MDEREMRRLSLELLETAEAAIVTTIDRDGCPETRAMFNLRRREQFPGLVVLFEGHEEDYLVYLTTNTSSKKVAHLAANPRASIYYCAAAEFRGLLLKGVLEPVTEANERARVWQPGWERYYPGGVNDPDHTVLKLRPASVRYYHQLRVADFPIRDRA